MNNNDGNGRPPPMDKVSLVALVKRVVRNPSPRQPAALEEMFRPTQVQETRLTLQQTVDQVMSSLHKLDPNEDGSTQTNSNDEKDNH